MNIQIVIFEGSYCKYKQTKIFIYKSLLIGNIKRYYSNLNKLYWTKNTIYSMCQTKVYLLFKKTVYGMNS